MEGKNCFRTRWTQEPIYSGGSIASVALPRRSFDYIRSLEQRRTRDAAREGASASEDSFFPETEECLVMACGDSLSVVRASNGEVVCRYTLPVEDVILHVDAVSVLSSDPYVSFGQAAMARSSEAAREEGEGGHEGNPTSRGAKGASKRGKKRANGKQPTEPEALKTEEENDEAVQEATSPELVVPMGCYVACGTRSLQLYLLQVVVTETTPLANDDDTQKEEKDGEEKNGEKADEGEPVVRYELRVLRYWTAAQQAISVVHFSRGGQFLLSGSTDGGIKVWNAFHHHLTHNFRCPSSSLLQAVYLDPTESFLITGSFEGHISVFDFVGKTLLAHSRPHVQAIDAVSLSEDGAYVYSIARDRRLSIQRLTPSTAQPSGNQRRGGGHPAVWTLTEEKAVVVREHVSAALFEDPHTLHIGSMDGILATYHIDVRPTNAGPAASAVCRNAKPPASHAEEPTEETLVKGILLCGRAKGTTRTAASRAFHTDGAPRTPQRSALYVADAGYNVIKYVSEAGSSLYRPTGTLVGFLDQVLDIKVFAPDRPTKDFPYQRVVVNNSSDVRLYGAEGCFSGQALRGHADIVMCCAVSSDGSLIVTGGKDREVRCWSTQTWQTVAVGVKGHTAELTAMCFNSKQTESYFLLFTISADENLRLWDVGKHVLPAMKSAAHPPALSAEGKGQQSPVTFEHRAGVNAAHAGAVYAVSVAPNDQYVATGGKDKVVHLWNITGKKIFKEATLKGHRRGISSLAFSPVDRVLASAANDGSVRLWSLVSLSCVKTLQVDKVAVLQVSFFNRGTQLVTGNAEGVMRVWAVASSEVVWASEVHQEKIWALSVVERDDGDTVFLSGAADGVLVATEDYTAEEAERLQQERHDVILKEQALANAVRRGEFTEAFMLALQLNHPRHLRQLLTKWCTVDAPQCEEMMKRVLIPKLSEEHLLRLLQFTREWITNSRHCAVASLVVYCFLGSMHFEELAKLPAMQALVEPLLAYSQRHSRRQHELIHRTYSIDYVTQAGVSTSGSRQRTLTSMPPFLSAEGKRLRLEEGPVPDEQQESAGPQQPPAKKLHV